MGVTSMPQPDGSLSALEVHIFPEAMRGTGEGHYPWDLRPQSTMTNANVERQVGATVDGRTLTLKYKDGEKNIFVPADTPIVIYELGTGQISRPAPRSSSSPSSSPTERSRVVRGASAAMAQRRPSDRVGFCSTMGCTPAFPWRAHRVLPVGPSMGFAALSAHPPFEMPHACLARHISILDRSGADRRPIDVMGLGGCWRNIVPPERSKPSPDELGPSSLRRQEHER